MAILETIKREIQEQFRKCIKIEHVKKLYRELALRFHPDRGGDLDVMKFLNNFYHEILKAFDGKTSYDPETKKEHTYRYDRAKEQAVMDKIFELVALKLAGIDIALMGTWIWVTVQLGAARGEAVSY